MNVRVERRRIGGLSVAVAEIPALRSVASVLALPAGQWFEPAGRPGVARLTAQALLRGTRTKDAAAWSDALDAIGATARLDVGGHAAFFAGQCLTADLGTYLELVADAVLHPAFDAGQVEFVRAQTLAKLEEDSKDTRAVADVTWRELAYPPGHPFRTRPLGEDAVLKSASVDEIRRFHRDAALGGDSYLVVAGGIEASAAFEAAERAFGGRAPLDPPRGIDPPGGTPINPPGGTPARRSGAAAATPPLAGVARRDVVVPDKTQCDVVLGWHGLPRPDRRFTAARVTNMVFAADTFASRAGNVVRDQLGLAYYVFSTIGASLGASPWTVRMGVNPGNVERAIETTFVELRKILAADVADEDLALAKDKLVGELDVALESPGGVAQLILEGELFALGDDHLERYPRALRAVTKEQVVETARAFLPADRYALAVAGPPLPR